MLQKKTNLISTTCEIGPLKDGGSPPCSEEMGPTMNPLLSNYSKEDDWGFTHFISWKDLTNPENCFVKDDSITIEAHVMAEAPHGVAWDSKKHTGLVGMTIKELL